MKKSVKKLPWHQKILANKKITVSIGILFVVYIISLFTPLISGYTQYPLHVVRCLGLPMVADTFSHSYTVPGTRAYGVTPFTDRFFCTEQEAQAAWFDKYDF